MNYEKLLKRGLGIVIIAVLMGLAFQAKATETTGAVTSDGWTKFVIYVREGPVEGAVVGGKCKGDGSTVGCARRRAAPPGALLDGECWITVREWNSTTREIVLKNWGHELGHCTGKHHDDKGNWYE